MRTLGGLAMGGAASAGASKRDTGGVARLFSRKALERAIGEGDAEHEARTGWRGRGGTRTRPPASHAPRAILMATYPPPTAAWIVDLVLLLSTHGGREREPARVAEQGQARSGAVVSSRAMGVRWLWYGQVAREFQLTRFGGPRVRWRGGGRWCRCILQSAEGRRWSWRRWSVRLMSGVWQS